MKFIQEVNESRGTKFETIVEMHGQIIQLNVRIQDGFAILVQVLCIDFKTSKFWALFEECFQFVFFQSS